MQTKENKIRNYSDILDQRYGKVGTPEREQFRKEAYAFGLGQVIQDARKSEKITQAELGKRIGADKSYISRIEKGIIDPSASVFYRIIYALGMQIDITKTTF